MKMEERARERRNFMAMMEERARKRRIVEEAARNPRQPPTIFILPMSASSPAQAQDQPLPMHARVWSKLPEDVLERVLSFLHPLSFVRMQCVCKRWSFLLLHSPRFLHLRRQISPPPLPFVAAMMEPLEDDANPPSSTSESNPSPWKKLTFHPTPFFNFVCRASFGGLLCCSWGLHSQQYIVCNPATKAWRDLPPLPLLEEGENFMLVPSIVGLVVDRHTSHYRVVITGQIYRRVQQAGMENHFELWIHGARTADPETLVYPDRDEWRTHVYDSLTRTWKLSSGSLPPGTIFQHFTHQTLATLWNGMLVWTGGGSRGRGLIMYHIEDEDWSTVETHSLPDDPLLRPQLMEHNGDLLMVGAVAASSCTVMIWKLELTQMEWIEVERMPIPIPIPPEVDLTMPVKEINNSVRELTKARSIQCVKSHELIYITVYKNISSVSGVFDLTRKVWRWLPECPSLRFRSIFPRLTRSEAIGPYSPLRPRRGALGVYFPFEISLEAVP